MKAAPPTLSRLIAAATALMAGAWVLLAWSNWRHLGNGVRFGSPWMAFDGQTLLLSRAVQAPAILGALALYAAAAAIGYAFIVRPIWGRRGLATAPWTAVAGFVPGMLTLVAVSRLSTLILPNSLAPGVIWAIILALAAFALWMVKPPPGPRLAPRRRGEAAVFVVICAAALVFSVHIDRMHVMGSASHDFIRDLFLSGKDAIGAAGHFPLVSQHYDEPAFLYPVVYGLLQPGPSADATMTAVYWPMLALGRLSIAGLVYLSIRGLSVDRLSATVLTAFVWAASLTLNPAASNVLFDSLSPLGETLHLARIFAPVLPLLFVSASVRLVKKPSLGALAVALLVGIGLSAMTASVALVFGFAAAALVLTAISPGAAARPVIWRAGAAAAFLVLAACAMAYGLQGTSPLIRGAVMVGAAAIGGLLVAASLINGWFKREDSDAARLSIPSLWRNLGASAPYWLVSAAGYGLGLIFLGNVLARAFEKRLGPVWPWHGVGYWDRYYASLATKTPVIMQSPYCHAGEPWGFRILTEHCGSLPMFSRTYGLSMVVIALVLAWRSLRPAPSAGEGRTETLIFWSLVLCLVAQPIGFFLFDFVFSPDIAEHWAQHLSMWMRARLVESWFYGGILLALCLFLRTAQKRERRWAQTAMLAGIAVFALNPLTVPAQLVGNAAYLADAFFRR